MVGRLSTAAGRSSSNNRTALRRANLELRSRKSGCAYPIVSKGHSCRTGPVVLRSPRKPYAVTGMKWLVAPMTGAAIGKQVRDRREV